MHYATATWMCFNFLGVLSFAGELYGLHRKKTKNKNLGSICNTSNTKDRDYVPQFVEGLVASDCAEPDE